MAKASRTSIPTRKRVASTRRMAGFAWSTRKRCASKSGFESRARAAKLRSCACVEDVDYRAIRGLDRALFLKPPLATGSGHGIISSSPAMRRRQELARFALGNKACRDDFAVAYHRVPRLFAALALGAPMALYQDAACYRRLDLLILDDWGPEPLDADQRRICSRSSRTDMKLVRSSSPASCPSTAGMKLSEIPPSPTQSSIASSTTPTHRTQRREPQKQKQSAPDQIGHLTFSSPTTSSNRPMRLTPRVAGFRSEYPAGFKLECMAGFVGTRRFRLAQIQEGRYFSSCPIYYSALP